MSRSVRDTVSGVQPVTRPKHLFCPPPKEGRALIVAGGGAWGAYATGLLRAWNHDYRASAGISTGNLIAPIAVGGQYERLVEAYTSVNLSAIFSVSPFTKKGNLRLLHAMKRLALRKGSLGEMHRLKSLINEFFPFRDFQKLYQQEKFALCGALNLEDEPHLLNLFRTDQVTYETFTQAMYASCCFWPVAEVATINDKRYVDGGYVETLLIDEILALGYRTVDVITLRPKVKQENEWQFLADLAADPPTTWKGFRQTGSRILEAIRHDTVYENLRKACIKAKEREDLTINIYNTPKKLSDNAMYFNQQQMQDWVKLGEDMAFDKRYVETY